MKNLESTKELYKVRHIYGDIKISTLTLKELYVINQSYLSKSELKEIETTTTKKIPQGQRFDKEYWNELSKFNVPEIDTNLRNAIAKSLEIEK